MTEVLVNVPTSLSGSDCKLGAFPSMVVPGASAGLIPRLEL